jgi:glucosyl-3-phosphoglycerate synthase
MHMPDLFQFGPISTLHRLGTGDWHALEEELLEYRESRPIALVIPCLYSELEGKAIGRIVEEIANASYIARIVIALDRATPEQYLHATQFFGRLGGRESILWLHSPAVTRIFAELEKQGLPLETSGKGRACWMAYGYVLSRPEIEVIALHDADIETYDRELLVRLCYPVGNPNLGFEFAKGYYARYSDRLHGRVMRLFLTPLLRALENVCGSVPLLSFLGGFRYPLAGEFAMSTDLARINRIPSDWGLEVGVLAEVYRSLAPRRVCQVDLCERYDHKHRELSPDDPSSGLMKMAIDIAKSLFQNLATEGVVFSAGRFRSLVVAYSRHAGDTILQYGADAAINDLAFDRHQEGLAVDTFVRALQLATHQFMDDPLGAPLIPNWNRVLSALPEVLERLGEAVESDAATARLSLAGKTG